MRRDEAKGTIMLISFIFLPLLFSSSPNGKKPQVFLAGVHNTPSKLQVRTLTPRGVW